VGVRVEDSSNLPLERVAEEAVASVATGADVVEAMVGVVAEMAEVAMTAGVEDKLQTMALEGVVAATQVVERVMAVRAAVAGLEREAAVVEGGYNQHVALVAMAKALQAVA
jgi:hypothetical protein